ncbi:DoxX family protein [Enterovirga rhinocerotis]|uniref:Putative oxidoreductase n=1 Tax=Enterovirga rhinocerotis TaxID=1339210 RepID=A0A4R7BXY9_9HYPH|nr:DoxX family protein [Enterovirga rhinocerotis]TDR90393.1 putative oxidoreductase [Enterovirga rhinocerotis]
MNLSALGGRLAPHLLSLMRLMAGLLFMQHGTQKLLAFPTAPANGMPAIGTLFWFGGIIELVGGLLIAVGLLTRPAAFLASGMCAFAYFLFHAQRNFFPILNGGELAALYAFVFLYIAAAGAGPWSVDAARSRLR